jgi:hypothetical protein
VFTLAFALQLRKRHGKTSVRVTSVNLALLLKELAEEKIIHLFHAE